MARVPMWAAVLIAIAGVIAIVQGWGGLTFSGRATTTPGRKLLRQYKKVPSPTTVTRSLASASAFAYSIDERRRRF
jgi:hypothetical protein